MADGYVQVPPDSSGKKVDTTELIRPDSVTVERERVEIDDGSVTLADVVSAIDELKREIVDFKMKLLGALN